MKPAGIKSLAKAALDVRGETGCLDWITWHWMERLDSCLEGYISLAAFDADLIQGRAAIAV